MAESIANVNLGRATITFNSVAVGHMADAVELTYTPEIYEVNVAKYGSGVAKLFQTGERLEVTATFSESDLDHIQMALQGSTLESGATQDQINLGKNAGAEITAAALVITPQGVTNQVITIYKAAVISAPTLMYSNAEENKYQVTWLATIDESQSSGEYLGHIGDADATSAFLTGGTDAEATYTNWTGISDGEFSIDIDGVNYDITGIDFTTGVTTMALVASKIQAAIRAATSATETVVWTSGDHFVITSSTTGAATSSISVCSTIDGGSGTDISNSTYMDCDFGNGVVTNAVG